MRRKRLLGIFLTALMLSTVAAAAGLQLTAVSISTQDTTTTIITIRANGAFTHTEYRPADNLLLVDLPGVSAGVLEGQNQTIQGPGLSSYRVESFQGTSGIDVARVEFNLIGTPFVTFNQDKEALEVRVTAVEAPAPIASAAPATPEKSDMPAPASQQVAPVAAPPASQAVAAPPASQTIESVPVSANSVETTPHQMAKMEKPAWVRSVNVIHTQHGIEVEIRANGVLKPTATKIADPDRIVVDLENARTLRPVQVPVKSDSVKSVRMALYQVNPPVTRVVVDLEANRDYQLIPSDNGLRVKLYAPSQVASLGAPPVPAPATAAVPVLPKAPAIAPAMVQEDSSLKSATAAAAPDRESVEQIAGAVPPADSALASPPIQQDSSPKSGNDVALPAAQPASETASPMSPASPSAIVQQDSVKPTTAVATPNSEPVKQAAAALAPASVTVAAPVAQQDAPKPNPAAATPSPEPVKQTAAATPAPKPTVVSPAAQPEALTAPTKVATPTREPAKEIASVIPPANPTVAKQPAPAQDFVVLQPNYTPKVEADQPSVRAADAASKFSGGKTEIALSNAPLPPAASASLHVTSPVSAAQQPTPPPQMSMTGRPKYTGEPISVNLKDVDLKDFFRLIHEISGLNVVLDPNVHGTLTLVLDDVPWDQALDIVLKNNGLERELDGNVLRIATVDTLKHEADSRRAQVEAQALAAQRITVTRFLSYAHSKDVLNTVKKLLSKRGEIVSDERTNALIIVDIPTVFPEIDRVLTQLDRKTPEVEIEARVVAASRNFAREIGTQLGFGWGNSASALGGAGSVGQSPLTAGYVAPPPYFTTPVVPTPTPGTTKTTSASIPLFSNLPTVSPTSGVSFLNIGRNYRIDAILTAAESRGLLKILSRPRVVTQNNIQAVVRQGVRIPVVTAAMLNGPPTTTYIDAFLRLTVTPQITIENTIFLNVDVENTTPDFSQEVQGNPTLNTQQATTQVLVTDGGTVVIGGVISTQNSVHIDQVPWLGSVPGLGNLFKHRAVSTQTQELFFFITPKIIQT